MWPKRGRSLLRDTQQVRGQDRTQGNSLVVPWLGLSTFTALAWVQSLVGELRSHSHGPKKRQKLMPFTFLARALFVILCLP